ncbi:MAG: hypothetical protein IJO60_04545 [Agathobacter sp.]|nr:hypothetical protein [Agathobacter sp.]
MSKANKKYKDSLFKYLFGRNKENALSLYNAINNTNYTIEDGFEFHILEDVIYMKMKNDVSFLIGTSLNLYEHQSTYNPNMPLRGFFYFADLYRKLIPENEKLYSSQLIKIPNPKFVVFYNGTSSKVKKDIIKLRLSDAFYEKDETGEFEWTATMININIGHNKDLFQKCMVLEHYSIFIHRVREYNNTMKSLEDAITKATEDCIKEGILKDILENQKKEAFDMVLTEFDEEKYEALIREEGREEGKLQMICDLVSKNLLLPETALEQLNISETELQLAMQKYGFKKLP